jgi:hypothetical protein
MQLKTILPRCSRPAWAKQGQEHLLGSILGLIIVSLLRGQRGTKPAPLLGRRLTRRQIAHLGFSRGTASCHATLEHFPIGLNRRGFPNQHLSDSSCMLVLEASMHG